MFAAAPDDTQSQPDLVGFRPDMTAESHRQRGSAFAAAIHPPGYTPAANRVEA